MEYAKLCKILYRATLNINILHKKIYHAVAFLQVLRDHVELGLITLIHFTKMIEIREDPIPFCSNE